MARISAIAVALLLLLTGCNGGEDETGAGVDPGAETTDETGEDGEATDTEAEDGTQEDGEAAAGAAEVATADSEHGQILVDAEGMALYVFDNDTDGTSACYDQCETNWPPLLTEGEPTAGEGADAALLGTTERTDGSMQVTYNGRPLYYFAADEAAGETKGQGVGGLWWVVAPDGTAIEAA